MLLNFQLNSTYSRPQRMHLQFRWQSTRAKIVHILTSSHREREWSTNLSKPEHSERCTRSKFNSLFGERTSFGLLLQHTIVILNQKRVPTTNYTVQNQWFDSNCFQTNLSFRFFSMSLMVRIR